MAHHHHDDQGDHSSEQGDYWDDENNPPAPFVLSDAVCQNVKNNLSEGITDLWHDLKHIETEFDELVEEEADFLRELQMQAAKFDAAHQNILQATQKVFHGFSSVLMPQATSTKQVAEWVKHHTNINLQQQHDDQGGDSSGPTSPTFSSTDDDTTTEQDASPRAPAAVVNG